MTVVIAVALVLSGAIHLLPLIGVAGPSRVARMYDVRVDGPDLAVLLVHRAVLFGLLGALLIAAAFVDDLQPYAIGAGLVSDVAFVAVARANPGINAAMQRVVRADVVSIVLLVVAAVSWTAAR
ncbi:phosphopantetheine adenylyltransferase [Aeromicrobium ginsengisoli]|uniref:Phosphopantetheine adenylyltransferase n=1 Tax=Aeromicrobium ginsengisoli TaxID=363867 RepID=A0A5M4FC57_9ACTN|nr:phosphopantetheine adenylyltransferase [Aeromicrobium ginsengisoli]KAA1395480.1 phosphopantetheine adenylyltransferase [Aeromicrobium ginsengisoli]